MDGPIGGSQPGSTPCSSSSSGSQLPGAASACSCVRAAVDGSVRAPSPSRGADVGVERADTQAALLRGRRDRTSFSTSQRILVAEK